MNYIETAHAIILYMTNTCNLNCSYCFSNFTNPVFKGDLNREIFDAFPAFINSLKRKEISVVFFGGEPTLRWEECKELYYRLQTECPEKKITCMIQTNGTLLDKYIEDIKQMENLKVYVSFDSSKEHHDCYRKFHDGADSWEIVKKNIDLLLKEGLVNRTTVVLTYLPHEGKTLYDNVQKLYDMGIRSVRTSIVKEGSMTEEDMAGILESNKKIADLSVRVRDLEYHKFGRFNLQEKAKVKTQYEIVKERRNPYTCLAGKERIFINTDGNIYPCSALVETPYILGNVITGPRNFSHTIQDMWKNEKCYTCEAKAHCLLCIHRCRINTGSLRNTCPKLEKDYSMTHKAYIDYFFELLEKEDYFAD